MDIQQYNGIYPGGNLFIVYFFIPQYNSKEAANNKHHYHYPSHPYANLFEFPHLLKYNLASFKEHIYILLQFLKYDCWI